MDFNDLFCPAEEISIGIVAGGKSSRMGSSKALLELNGKSFLKSVYDELKGSGNVLISVAKKGDYSDLCLDATFVYDEHKEIGAIEGIYQILKNARTEYVFICASDMPLINKDVVDYLSEFICSDYDCYVTVSEDRIHPLCAIYSKKLLPLIEKHIADGKYRLMDILRDARTKYISLEKSAIDVKVVKNINTKDLYKELVLPVVFCVSGVKNSGKTGLIIKLINEFIKKGMTVGVIKHDGHDFSLNSLDVENTDSYKFFAAGAKASSVYSSTKYCTYGYSNEEASFAKILDSYKEFDIVIIEGMKNSAYPKIEVIRKGISETSVCDENTLICIASDLEHINTTVKVVNLNNVDHIVKIIEEKFPILKN